MVLSEILQIIFEPKEAREEVKWTSFFFFSYVLKSQCILFHSFSVITNSNKDIFTTFLWFMSASALLICVNLSQIAAWSYHKICFILVKNKPWITASNSNLGNCDEISWIWFWVWMFLDSCWCSQLVVSWFQVQMACWWIKETSSTWTGFWTWGSKCGKNDAFFQEISLC